VITARRPRRHQRSPERLQHVGHGQRHAAVCDGEKEVQDNLEMPLTGKAGRRISEPINVVHECLPSWSQKSCRKTYQYAAAGNMGFPRREGKNTSFRPSDLVQSLRFQLERDVPDPVWRHAVADLIENPLVMHGVVQDAVSAERHKTARERPHM